MALLALASVFVLLAPSTAGAAGPLAPINDWTELSPPQAPNAVYDGSSAFDEASGEMVYFGGTVISGETNETWIWDGSDWTKENPAHSPPVRGLAAMAFDPSTGKVLLFGGNDGGTSYDDTWAWDGGDWTQLSPASKPSGRTSASMAFDASTGRMLLFGGSNADGFLNDTWAWNGSNWTQLAPAHSPPVRNGAAMAFDQATGKTVLFGGHQGGGTYLGDTWTWNGNDWAQESPAQSPVARAFAAMDFNPAIGKTVLFGGGITGGQGDDTWAWSNGNWTEVSSADRPAGRRGPVMSFDPSIGSLVMAGGATTEDIVNDTWSYGPPPGLKANWSEKSPANHPSARSGATMAYDPANGETLLFGGSFNGAGYSDETWAWDGTNWTQKNPAHKPPVRTQATMAFDQARAEMLLFGGFTGTYHGDTWTWDGTDWTEKHPATSPPVLAFAASAFDPSTGKVVLFGGTSDNVDQGDTWTWNGSNWTKLSPANHPSARQAPMMAFDPTIGKIVLFGGYDAAGFRNDTWLWDGNDWTEVIPDHSPSSRTSAGMAFDPSLGKVVMFGGHPGSSSATWTWDGGDWSQASPVDHPSGRDSSAMSFDPSSGETVLFGGLSGAGSGNSKIWDDTWAYSLEVDAPTATITAPADGGIFTIGEDVTTEFSCDESPGGPGIASCDDSNGGSAPVGALDTSTLGPQTYAVTATSQNGLTGTAHIDYRVEKAEPTVTASGADATAVIGSRLRVDGGLADAYQPGGSLIFRAYGPGDATCDATPAYESPPVTVTGNGLYFEQGFNPTEIGIYRWTVSYSGGANNQEAGSECDAAGSVTEVTKATPDLAANSASDSELGGPVTVKATVSGGFNPGGTIVFRAYGPDDATCSAAPAFESGPVAVTGAGDYDSPGFTPEAVGTYSWVASYSGDADNEAATSDCGASGSVSTVTKTPTPPPGYKCPKARPGLKLTGFGLKPPYGKASPVFGVRVAFGSKNAVVKFTPSITYRLAGKNRTVKLKGRTLKVNGRRLLRFRAPNQLMKDFRKAGTSPRQAPVTFKVKAKIRPQGSRAKCFRNLGVRKLKTRMVNVSGRVALRRLGGF